MAQTKKKRRKKHRGTQGGSIAKSSNRRPRNREEARAQARRNAELKRGGPPTWQSAIFRAVIMAALLFALMAFIVGEPVGQAAALSIVMMVFYVPAGYYLERFLYRRRQAKALRERQLRREQSQGRR